MPSEYEAFESLVSKVVSTPAAAVKARIEEHRERAKRNPRRRGPKPKVKTSASGPASRDED